MDTQNLSQAFVDITRTLVDDFDIHDLLRVLADRSLELFGAAAVGLLLADEQGRLRTVASDETTRLLDLLQIQYEEGPCLESFERGEAVVARPLRGDDERWLRFANAATAQGYHEVVAVPLRLNGRPLGALNLFATSDGASLADAELGLVQAMADVATVAIMQDRLARRHRLVADQLQAALESRVQIEQAKGVLATRHDIGMSESFEMLRQRARSSRRRIVEVAHEVLRGEWDGRSPA